MSGFQHHDVLGASVLTGAGWTEASWALLDLGRFPGVVPGAQSVEGEVYRVHSTVLERLDVLEGAPEFYRRERVVLLGGQEVFMYVLQPAAVPEAATPIPSASWRQWCTAKAR